MSIKNTFKLRTFLNFWNASQKYHGNGLKLFGLYDSQISPKIALALWTHVNGVKRSSLKRKVRSVIESFKMQFPGGRWAVVVTPKAASLPQSELKTVLSQLLNSVQIRNKKRN